jgi:predicted transcriptional regulator
MQPNDEKFSKIINLLNNGYPIRVIAKLLHVNIYYIRKICEENNIPILDKREALKRAKRLALGVKKTVLRANKHSL